MSQQFIIAPETIIQAYTLGIFPMATSKDSRDIQFFQPDVRGVLPFRPPKIPKKLLRLLKKQPFKIQWNQNFPAVIDGCAAPRTDTKDTWINPMIRRLYISLHMLGFAHSVEAYHEGNLIGGLLGLINPALGFIGRGITSSPEMLKNFKDSRTLAEFFNKVKNKKEDVDDLDNTTLSDEVSSDLPFAKSYIEELRNKMPTNLSDYEGLTNLDFIGRTNLNDLEGLSNSNF